MTDLERLRARIRDLANAAAANARDDLRKFKADPDGRLAPRYAASSDTSAYYAKRLRSLLRERS